MAGIHLFGSGDPKHFGSLGAALMSLFQIVTLDNWGDIFTAQLPHVPAAKVAIYFVTFIVFGTMIILNLFIGIIMNSMSEMHAELEARDRLPRADETGIPSLADELALLERQLKRVQARLAAQGPQPSPAEVAPVMQA